MRYTFFDPVDRLLTTNKNPRGISLMSNEIKVDGACYCGDVTINGTVSADKVMACHCTDCQKVSGAPFRAVAVMSAEQVTISGAVKEYLKIADSGNERVQGFCGNCGSQIFATDPAKTLYLVRTGCLSQHDQLVPAKHIFGKSATSWLGSIENQQWVTEGPTSAEMAPPTRK